MITLSLMAWIATASAPTRITLEEARAQSRKNTQALLALLDVERAEQELRLARAPLMPQVGFLTAAGGALIGRQRVFTTVTDASGGYAQETVEVPTTSHGNFDLSLSLSQIIYDRARWKQLEQSGAAVEASRGQAQEQADASELEGISRFLTLYRTQIAIQVLEASVSRSEAQLSRARALYQSGRAGRDEELAAEVNLGNDRINLLVRRAQLAQDRGQLAVWLGRHGNEVLDAVAPDLLSAPLKPAPPLEAAIAEALDRRPLIRALRQQLRVAELSKDVANSGYLPRLVAQSSYSRSGTEAGPVFTEPALQNTLSGSVVLQWDIFNGLATTAQMDRAQVATRVATLNLAQAERELEADVQRSIQTLELQISATQLATANREAALQSLAVAEERFQAGVGSTLEVRNAQLNLTQVELALLESRVNVQLARFALRRAIGTLSSEILLGIDTNHAG